MMLSPPYLYNAQGLVDVAIDVTQKTEPEIRALIAQDENQSNMIPDLQACQPSVGCNTNARCHLKTNRAPYFFLQGVERAIDCSGVGSARHLALACTRRWGTSRRPVGYSCHRRLV